MTVLKVFTGKITCISSDFDSTFEARLETDGAIVLSHQAFMDPFQVAGPEDVDRVHGEVRPSTYSICLTLNHLVC